MLSKIINVGLIKEPYNWIIVLAMCMFAVIFLGMVFPQETADG